VANGRTGCVSLADFDAGLATSIGAELVDIELDGETVQQYAVSIDGVTGPDETSHYVPVYFSEPEDAYLANLLPQIVISRTSITPQMNRWFPPGTFAYQAPAANATTITATNGVQGPSHIEFKPWAIPHEFSYDMHLRARLRSQANNMLAHVARTIWAYGQISFQDTEGEQRGYYAFVEGYESLAEISDVADRLMGFTVSMRVEGELDFQPPFVRKVQARIGSSINGAGGILGPSARETLESLVPQSSIDNPHSGDPGGSGGESGLGEPGQMAGCPNLYVLKKR